MKHTNLALLAICASIFTASQVLADVNVLIVGSTKDSSERFGGSSKPFSPTAIRTELNSILSGCSGLGNVNVTVSDRYATDTTVLATTVYAYNLESWFHWPFPKGAESNRWANLRGEAGTNWDYVVLIGDPYTIENMPGLYALGVADIANEVAKGGAETILLMPWPALGSSSSTNHYKEVVYRAGRSGGLKVAPAGLAWSAIKGTARTNPNPNADGAFIAAASIYSTIYKQSASVSAYVYNDGWANTVNTTEVNNRSAPQYTGAFSFQNPFLFNTDTQRKIYFSSRGSSTESYFKDAAVRALGRCNVGVTAYCPWNRSETDWANNGGDEPWTTWPAGTPTPIAWNDGRDYLTSEWYKSYQINPTYWTFAYAFYYHASTWSYPVDDANAHYIGQMCGQDFDMAKRMITEGASGRSLPLRTLWAQIHKEFPDLNPQLDGSGPHLSLFESEAVGTYMYTLYSGRCPLDPKPAVPDENWVARRIGYETAWKLGHCQTRAPGFKVKPTAWSASNVTTTASQTLSVQFILAPTSDVTVAITSSDLYKGVVNPTQITFTPENYSNAVTVTVLGETGAAGTFPFDVTFTTSSGDEVCNGLSDSWNFVNTRSAGPTPSAIWIQGNGYTIASGDTTPLLADSTDFGVAYGLIEKTFTITNKSVATTVNLTGSPKVTVTDAAGNFTLLQDASAGSLSAGAATTFKVRYNPLSGGLHTGTVSVASSDAAIPVYSFKVQGYNPTAPTVDLTGAAAIATTNATLSGELSAGGYAKAWICWGENDAGTSSTGAWSHVVSLGQVSQSGTFSTIASGLDANATYWYRCYVSSAAGADWSDEAGIFSGVPEVGTFEIPITNGLVAHWDAMSISDVADGGQVTAWANSANPGSFDLSLLAGAPVYRASVPGFDGKPAVEFASGGGDSFQFTEIANIRTVFWVLHDSQATDNTLQFLLGDDNTYNFHGGVTKIWDSAAHANVKNGSTEVDGVAVDGTLVDRPAAPAIISVVTIGNVTASRVSKDRGYTRSWEGEIAEILIYDVPLSSNDEDLVGSYLAAKYGLSTSYPAGIGAAAIRNTGATSITASSAALNASVDIAGTYSLYIHWGTTDRGSDASAWDSSVGIGSYSDIVTNISYTVGGLSQGQRYYYTVRGSNDAGNVWASPSWSFIPSGVEDSSSVAAPTGLLIPVVTASRVDLIWSDNSTNETGFLVERSITSGSGFGAIGSVLANSTSYSDTTVTTGNTYYYRVTATNGTDSSAASGEATAMVPGIPVVVNNGTAATNTTSATLSGLLTSGGAGMAWICWGDNEVGTAKTSDWDHVVLVGSVTEAGTFSVVVDNLSTNSTYWYRCYVSNVAGSGWSDSATFNGLTLTSSQPGVEGGAVLSTDFAGRTVSGSAAQNITWTTIGLANPGDVTAVRETPESSSTFEGLFDTADSGGHFAVNRNIGNEGPWSVDIPLVPSSSSQVDVESVLIDWQDFNNSGAYQFSSYPKLFTVTIKDSSMNVLGVKTVTASTAAGANTATFASPVTLTSGNTYTMNIRAENNANTTGNNTGLDAITVYGSVTASGAIANLAPSGATATSASLSAIVDASGTNYDVYVYWGTSDGGSNASSWEYSAYLGSWYDVATNLSYELNGLIRGQTYYYTFCADDSWGVPSWQFTTPAGGVLTTNHLIPHSWIDLVATNAVTDYEDAAMADPDGDGFSTWEEYWSGTNPNESNSFLRIDAVMFDGINVVIEWQNDAIDAPIPDITIEATTNLITGPWFNAGHQAPTNGDNAWSEKASQQLFYRLAVTSAP